MATASKLQAGDIIGGRYEIIDQLGIGGFGAVYRARQKGMNREIAVKTLLPHLGAVEELEERFQREATLASNLVCPHTIRMYDFGRTEDGMLYIAMELLRGKELDDELKEGKFPPDRVRKIGMMILLSLAEAHGQGIVHRDLKPSNIFLTEVGKETDYVKVLDFGIAKAVDKSGDEDAGKLTATGQALGTPYYMAPEQIRGDQVGSHTDIYAVGLIMLEMIVGQTVMVGKTPIETVLLQVSPDPVPIPDDLLATPLGQVIARAVDKNWQTRYQNAEEMITDLERIDVSGMMGMTFDPQNPVAPVQGQFTGRGPAMSGPYPQQMQSGPYPQQMQSGPYPQQMGATGMMATGAYGYPNQEKNTLKIVLLSMLIVLVLVGAAVAFVVMQDDGNEAEAKSDTSNKAAAKATPEGPPKLSIVVFNNAQEALMGSAMRGIRPAIGGMAAELQRRENELAAANQVALVIHTSPKGAQVLRNGVYFGVTPIDAKLEKSAGLETWKITLDDHKDREVEVDLSKGGTFDITLDREKKRTKKREKKTPVVGEEKKEKKKEEKKEEKKGNLSVD